MDDMDLLFHRVVARLKENHSLVDRSAVYDLHGMAPSRDIKLMPSFNLNSSLPEDLRGWIDFLWMERIGGSIFQMGIVDVFAMQSIAEVVCETEDFEHPEFSRHVRFNTARIALPHEWKNSRLCILYGTSQSCYVVDLSPGENGTFGQIIYCGDAGTRQKVAFESISMLFEKFLELPNADDAGDHFSKPPWDFEVGLSV